VFAADGGYDPGEASHAALLEIRRSAEKHPAVEQARGHPSSLFTQVRMDVVPERLGRSSSSGVLTVRWYAGDTRDARPEFSFHYSEESGFDCGWHHEPNPHVDGWGHYQTRQSTADEYQYTAVSFGSKQPVRVFWEILERLESGEK
jgi:hypothetical protein